MAFYIDPFDGQLEETQPYDYPFYNPAEYVESLVQYTEGQLTTLLNTFISQSYAEDQSYLTSFFASYTTIEQFKTRFPVDFPQEEDEDQYKFLRNLTAYWVLTIYQIIPNNPYFTYLMTFVTNGVFTAPTVANFDLWQMHFMSPEDYPLPPTLTTIDTTNVY